MYMTSIVTTLKDFDDLLSIAKAHGLVEFKIGEIHVILPPPPPEKDPIVFTNERPRTSDEIDAEIYNTTISI